MRPALSDTPRRTATCSSTTALEELRILTGAAETVEAVQ
jgi:hypothetical protein